MSTGVSYIQKYINNKDTKIIMVNYKLFGYIIVTLGIIIFFDALKNLVGYDVISALWPFAFIIAGISTAPKHAAAGLLLLLAGVAALISRFNLGGTSLGQAFQALVVIAVGFLIISNYGINKKDTK